MRSRKNHRPLGHDLLPILLRAESAHRRAPKNGMNNPRLKRSSTCVEPLKIVIAPANIPEARRETSSPEVLPCKGSHLLLLAGRRSPTAEFVPPNIEAPQNIALLLAAGNFWRLGVANPSRRRLSPEPRPSAASSCFAAARAVRAFGPLRDPGRTGSASPLGPRRTRRPDHHLPPGHGPFTWDFTLGRRPENVPDAAAGTTYRKDVGSGALFATRRRRPQPPRIDSCPDAVPPGHGPAGGSAPPPVTRRGRRRSGMLRAASGFRWA